ncbi:MAG: sulfurtransferase [Microbacterium sp.]|uniref:rhodanese-like domain-containing protein n=1 Tax=Microbacterium TaxID=33882 RepID=UPI000C63A239|nr:MULTISPECIES: rhodanese-like domain-containing protein [Microbacterium]MAB20367.1 sulfurtransferase [Microbacterium sp.]MAM54741.1 sulfurtransferase [Microbacterium sp.]MAY48712.1 sulfurtransferase [Microbacterium sp.]HAS33374.1 sulfurtransferase [Microbacterium sp.]HBR88364.1 sulfurtransferase [Microbacterium sp.]|tara:strand:- start:171 stop:581 length:411 start_codon:yes stop_codon:yes gene_type:complete
MTSDALTYFENKLAHETDASDVYAAQHAGDEFVLVDVRSDEAWRQGRIRGAIHLPHQRIATAATDLIAAGTPVVVYCWSPGCNGGAKGAAAFARLGYDVKEMIGGYEYWVREGQPTVNDDGELPRVFDPQVMVVRA